MLKKSMPFSSPLKGERKPAYGRAGARGKKGG